MQEMIKVLIGIVVLVLGFPIGNYLHNLTKDEEKKGQVWFLILTYVGIAGGIIGLIFWSDWIIFTFLFIAIVSSRSLVVKKVPGSTKAKK